MGPTELLVALGVIFPLMLTAGGAVVYFRKGSVDGLRASNDDLRKERDDWQRRYEDELQHRTRLEGRVANLETEGRRKDAALVRIGEEAVGTGDIRELAEGIKELAQLSGHHDVQAEERHRGTVNALVEFREAIVDFRDALEHRQDPPTPGLPA